MAVFCAAITTAGCSGPDVLNALTPNSGYVLKPDIPYGDGPRQRLDLYLPDKAAESVAFPTIVFFYGGSWQTGAREDYRFVGEAFASLGYQVAIPDYRLYPEARFPEFLKDSAAAVAWAKANSAGPLFLAGHSAGAYNAAMLALDARWLADVGLDPASDVAAVATLAGPFDFLPLTSPALKEIFGPEDGREATQPINYVSPTAPPFFLATGPDDETVLPKNSVRLSEALAAAGGSAELRYYDRVGHLTIVAALAKPLRFLAPARADFHTFFQQEAIRFADK